MGILAGARQTIRAEYRKWGAMSSQRGDAGTHTASVGLEVRDAPPPAVTRMFLLLRYTLIVATAYLLVAEGHFTSPPVSSLLLITAALASNVLLAGLRGSLAYRPALSFVIVVGDTLWITAALLQTGRFNSEFYFLYFFVLLLAAIGENLALITIAACFVCLAYVYLLQAGGGNWLIWGSPSLIRIPFLFTTAAFYGHLVERSRADLRRAKQEEKASEQEVRLLHAKSDMIATVSHELRTPLHIIIGYNDVVRENAADRLTADERHCLERIHASAHELSDLINAMLDLSRLEAGRMPLYLTDTNLASLAQEIADETQELQHKPGVTMEWCIASNLPPLRTDASKLKIVIKNLISNALKFTEQGTVTMVACSTPEGAEICVTDTGPGIASEALALIFEPFRQLAEPNGRQSGGVGLGLCIVQRFIEALNGRISVDSEVGRGSSFRVWIPHSLPTASGTAVGDANPGILEVGTTSAEFPTLHLLDNN